MEKVNIDQTFNKKSLQSIGITYNGKRSYSLIEKFIGTLVRHKEIEEISDEQALKEMPLLLKGYAFQWWKQNEKDIERWEQVLPLLRKHFAPGKPAFLIYVQLFAHKQDAHEPIEQFVGEKRALLAQLPAQRHNEAVELDMVYGLLHLKYRKRLQRDELKNFQDLIDKVKMIDFALQDTDTERQVMKHSFKRRANKKGKRCRFCKNRGHIFSECRKRLNAQKTNKEEVSAANESIEHVVKGNNVTEEDLPDISKGKHVVTLPISNGKHSNWIRLAEQQEMDSTVKKIEELTLNKQQDMPCVAEMSKADSDNTLVFESKQNITKRNLESIQEEILQDMSTDAKMIEDSNYKKDVMLANKQEMQPLAKMKEKSTVSQNGIS